jgi:hypothetical protein
VLRSRQYAIAAVVAAGLAMAIIVYGQLLAAREPALGLGGAVILLPFVACLAALVLFLGLWAFERYRERQAPRVQ